MSTATLSPTNVTRRLTPVGVVALVGGSPCILALLIFCGLSENALSSQSYATDGVIVRSAPIVGLESLRVAVVPAGQLPDMVTACTCLRPR